jgi:hypothetical protein
MFQQQMLPFRRMEFSSYVLTIMPHITSSRVTQYQAKSIVCVTICQKFINSLNYFDFIPLGIGYFPPAPPLPYLTHFTSTLTQDW